MEGRSHAKNGQQHSNMLLMSCDNHVTLRMSRDWTSHSDPGPALDTPTNVAASFNAHSAIQQVLSQTISEI